MFAKILVSILFVTVAHSRVLHVKNIGSASLSVSVTGQSDIALLAGATTLVTVADDFSGSVSAIPSGSEDIGIPRSRAELTLSATGDSYAVSVIDGFNLKVKVVPVQGTNCSTAVCAADLISRCPVANQVINSLGIVVACNNSPTVFRTICPKAVVTSDDATNVFTCQATSYLILLG